MTLSLGGKHWTHSFYQHVTGLLQQYNNPARGVVILGVSPNQADDMHERWEMLSNFIKFRLFYIFKETPERFQMQIDVLSFRQCCKKTILCYRSLTVANIVCRRVFLTGKYSMSLASNETMVKHICNFIQNMNKIFLSQVRSKHETNKVNVPG